MGYVNDNLVANEKVVKTGKIHWGIYVPGAIWLGLSMLLFIGNSRFIGMLFFLFAILSIVRAFIYEYSTELVITDKRVIAKFGLIRRRTIELLHTKVEGLSVDQRILGRILNFGTVIVQWHGFRTYANSRNFATVRVSQGGTR